METDRELEAVHEEEGQLARISGAGEVYPDFSELYFEGGFLYKIQRSSRRVLKITPKE